MEITQLHYFKIVAKYESFTKAAEELHITQSALSRSISQLEKDIGLPLFARKRGGKISLNHDGIFFLKHVIQILNTLENTVASMNEIAGLERGIINIALAETIFIKNVIYQFLVDYPNVRLNCRLQSNEQMVNCLKNGTINFALCKTPIPDPDLIWQSLFTDRMTVVVPFHHPFAGKKSVCLNELRQEHFIISNLGYDMDSEFLTMCGLAGFKPYIVYEGSGEDLCGSLVQQGVGIMIVPFSVSLGVQMMGFAKDAVVSIPLSDDFARSEIGIVLKRGQFQSEAALLLYERIVEFYSTQRVYNH